jgi:ankyrin repeat protein
MATEQEVRALTDRYINELNSADDTKVLEIVSALYLEMSNKKYELMDSDSFAKNSQGHSAAKKVLGNEDLIRKMASYDPNFEESQKKQILIAVLKEVEAKCIIDQNYNKLNILLQKNNEIPDKELDAFLVAKINTVIGTDNQTSLSKLLAVPLIRDNHQLLDKCLYHAVEKAIKDPNAVTSVAAIMQAGGNPHFKSLPSKDGKSAFICALDGTNTAGNTNVSLLAALLPSERDVDFSVYASETPHILLRGNNTATTFLLSKGVSVDLKDHNGQSALMLETREYTTDPTKMNLLLTHGANVNLQDKYGQSALMLETSKYTPDPTKMDLLLTHGANVNLQDKNQKTALMLETSKTNADLQIMTLLLDHGADVNLQDKDGKTALSRAILNNNVEVIGLLIKKGAKVTDQDLQLSHKPDVQAVLEKSPGMINKRRTNDNTLLIEAAIAKDSEQITSLITNQADITLQNNEGKTALYYLMENISTDNQYRDPEKNNIIKGILKIGSLPNNIFTIADKNGTTPLDILVGKFAENNSIKNGNVLVEIINMVPVENFTPDNKQNISNYIDKLEQTNTALEQTNTADAQALRLKITVLNPKTYDAEKGDKAPGDGPKGRGKEPKRGTKITPS